MPVKDMEDTQGLLDEEQTQSPPAWLRSRGKSDWSNWLAEHAKYFAAAAAFFAATNLVMLILLIFPGRSAPEPCSMAVNIPPKGVPPSMAHLTSPLVHELQNVTFYDWEHSIWRMHESVEANQAWVDYAPSRAGYILLPEAEAALADLDPSKHAFIDAPEFGLRGYPVVLEAVHQMHCIDMLRKYSYLEVEHTRRTCDEDCTTPPEYIGWHIDHCVEVLRQRIACTADMNLIPFFWLGTEGRLTGDFGRTHSCSNYDVLRQYTVDKATLAPFEGKVRPKPGDYWVPDYI